MQKAVKYTIFKTKWGYFGVASTEFGLLRTHLPGPEPEIIKSRLLANIDTAEFDKALFKTIQEQITVYFEGDCVNFSRDIPIVLEGLSAFARCVLTACRDIRFGRTISYGQLAQKAGNLNAARAVGNALAKNPLPLIIPCHRVVCANGKIGGFSAIGGEKLKRRMLELEENSIKSIKMGSLGKRG